MATVKTLVRLSIPAAVEETLTSTARILSSFMIASLGTVAFGSSPSKPLLQNPFPLCPAQDFPLRPGSCGTEPRRGKGRPRQKGCI